MIWSEELNMYITYDDNLAMLEHNLSKDIQRDINMLNELWD